mmetsp:Transcript_33537/g.77358  ORF Transcript_33537/g.77358 Transcript_33537/m.77358 type:complete len:312 (+) Transcript_33537:89-1024(+)
MTSSTSPVALAAPPMIVRVVGPAHATKIPGSRQVADASCKADIQELLLLLRRALHMVCEELRRTHKCNKQLEERHNALAAELDELFTRTARKSRGGPLTFNEFAEHVAVPARAVAPTAGLSTSPTPPRPCPGWAAGPAQLVPFSSQSPAEASAAVSPSPVQLPPPNPRSSRDELSKEKGRNSGGSTAGTRRVTLKLSRSVLRKLSADAGLAPPQENEESDSGSEIFEANKPEDVVEMQKLLQHMSWKYEYMTEGETMAGQEGNASSSRPGEEEPETSPSVRASLSRRLAPGLEDSTGSLPPRRLTLFQGGK